MAKRRRIREYIRGAILLKGIEERPGCLGDITQFFSTIPDLKKHVGDLQKMLENAKGAGYSNIVIGLDTQRIPYDDDYEIEATVTGERFETVAEKRKREGKAAKAAVSRKKNKLAAAERKEARDRAEFERLKAKFG